MPRVSVILPAYLSEATVSGCLSALRGQTFRDFEVVLVDSGPGGGTGAIAARDFPEVVCHVSAARMLPHAARNLGVTLARGELLVFSDPDTYAHPDWLERLVAAWEAAGGIVVGAIANHGHRWLDTGVHLCKFSKLLPGGPSRPIDIAPTANVLCSRETFEAIGPIPADVMQGDAGWSRRALADGHRLTFAPDAVVDHHHLETLRSFLSERRRRGLEFGRMRREWENDHPVRLALIAVATVLPVRALRIGALVTWQCARAGSLLDLAWTAPLVAAGHLASLWGEAVALLGPSARRRPVGI
ncbi:MAG: glycosyltransferase family 2 protein [Holophagales bacterium]|jgi:glycosyltransferase involved in cell wall biosynthesis|nr:glycosyltransferase family 2 protein [Holophagales bacterium]